MPDELSQRDVYQIAFSKWAVSFLMRKWDGGIAEAISMYKFGSGSETLTH